MEQEAILILLKSLSNQISPKFERSTGISSSRYDLLRQLYITDEVTQSYLQKTINIDSAAITRHLKQLEAHGMVTRRRNPDDQRETFVSLTDHGRSHIMNCKEDRNRFVHQMLQDFSADEMKLLTDLLQRMQNNVNKI